MADIISKLITGVVFLLIFVFFAYLGVISWQYNMGMIGAISFTISLGCIVAPITEYIDKKKEERQKNLRKIYNIPERINNEYGDVWDRELQKAIRKAIDTTTDSTKLTDLQQCQRVASQMMKDSVSYRFDRPFYKINNAFRLTGCHFTVTDSQGNIITKIV